MTHEAWSQDLGGLLKGILKEVQKDVAGQTAPDAKTQKSQKSDPSIVPGGDFDKAWGCSPRVTMLWPPTIYFDSPSCNPPSMPASEQERLKSVLISHYKWDDPKSRSASAFERDQRTIGARARNGDFYACLDELKRLPATISDKELNEDERWTKECRQYRHSVDDWTRASQVKKQKQDEIESYRQKTRPQELYEKCLAYIDSVAPVAANKSKLIDSSDTRYQGTFPSQCADDWGVKHPPSKEQYADIAAKRKAKFDVILKDEVLVARTTIGDALKKHRGTIEGLNIPLAWLKSTIIFQGTTYRSLEEWIALTLNNKNVKTLSTVRLQGNYGITVKVPQKPTEGFVFRKDDNELYPTHYIAGNDPIRISTEGDLLTVALRMRQFETGN
ncbi:MAG TPA: hypothetical protein PLY87_25565 [Planctomycetaceae bacterium]|nr:hypothetical protein [Planctomycetaceae bacterium]